MVLCTWQLLGLGPWLAPGGPPLALAAWTGFENATLTLSCGGFIGASLSKPHTSGTALQDACVCLFACGHIP